MSKSRSVLKTIKIRYPKDMYLLQNGIDVFAIAGPSIYVLKELHTTFLRQHNPSSVFNKVNRYREKPLTYIERRQHKATVNVALTLLFVGPLFVFPKELFSPRHRFISSDE